MRGTSQYAQTAYPVVFVNQALSRTLFPQKMYETFSTPLRKQVGECIPGRGKEARLKHLAVCQEDGLVCLYLRQVLNKEEMFYYIPN